MGVAWGALTAALMPKLGHTVHAQCMSGFPALDKGAISEMVKKGRDNDILIRQARNNKSGFVADLGAVGFGGHAPKRATYQTSPYRTAVEVGIQAADETKSNEDAVDLVKEAILTMTDGAAAEIGNTFFQGGLLFTLAATVSSGSSSFTVTDSTGFEPGLTFEVVRSGSVIETGLEVQDRTVGALGTNKTITLVNATTVEWNSGDEIRLVGSNAQAPKGMTDVCSAATLYGIGGTTFNWSGASATATGSNFSKDELENLEDDRFDLSGGIEGTHVVGSKRTERLIYRADKDLSGYGAKNHDPRGKAPLSVDGMTYCADKCTTEGNVYITNPKYIKLHTSLKLAPPGSNNKSVSRAEMKWSELRHAYLLPMRAAFAIRPEVRSAAARYSGFTS